MLHFYAQRSELYIQDVYRSLVETNISLWNVHLFDIVINSGFTWSALIVLKYGILQVVSYQTEAPQLLINS